MTQWTALTAVSKGRLEKMTAIRTNRDYWCRAKGCASAAWWAHGPMYGLCLWHGDIVHHYGVTLDEALEMVKRGNSRV